MKMSFGSFEDYNTNNVPLRSLDVLNQLCTPFRSSPFLLLLIYFTSPRFYLLSHYLTVLL